MLIDARESLIADRASVTADRESLVADRESAVARMEPRSGGIRGIPPGFRLRFIRATKLIDHQESIVADAASSVDEQGSMIVEPLLVIPAKAGSQLFARHSSAS
jgi:hypothetical protein